MKFKTAVFVVVVLTVLTIVACGIASVPQVVMRILGGVALGESIMLFAVAWDRS